MLDTQRCLSREKDVQHIFTPRNWDWGWLVAQWSALPAAQVHTKFAQAGPEMADNIGDLCIIYMARGSPSSRNQDRMNSTLPLQLRPHRILP